MDIAKSLFNVRDHEGYVGKEDHNVSIFIYSISMNFSFDYFIYK